MQRSQRLQVVLDQSSRKEKEALERMASAQERLLAQQKRLEELQQFHAEYQNQMRGTTQGKVTIQQLQSWQRFISQLAIAIQQQQGAIQQASRQVDEARRLWQLAWEKRRGMDKFIQECRISEEYVADKKEQQRMDEAAMQAFVRRTRG